MQINKLIIVCFILVFLISPVINISASSFNDSPPTWNSDWSYRQEIILPISTDNLQAKFQPIDLLVEFDNPCWAKNEKEHSVRVVCWDGKNWYELESQIYDLEFAGTDHIKSCRVVFLIPELASGKERYFVYYDESEKPSTNYKDHVTIEDAYYYFEPVSSVSIEGDYYKISEDGYCVYGIGQKGQVFDRSLAQTVVRMKPGSKEFSVVNSDNIISLGFAYSDGPKDQDQVSSDQTLVSKEISVDGNLMVEFSIVSQSNNKVLRTTNVYRYYYCPTTEKRIFAHVKHEVFQDCTVTGQENIDGIYGALVSFYSKSSRVKVMNFGEIMPYLHVFDKNNQIREYKMDTNPESKDREWIVPYTDDCDLGKDAWISYDEGESGKVIGIMFPSNRDIVEYGQNETDGIQVKSAEKEYLNALGTEIDYAGVIFGRNSYELGGTHDLTISGGLTVEFDTELYTSENKGYMGVVNESQYFRDLVKLRGIGGDGSNQEKNIYTLTVIPKFCGRILSFPIFSNISELSAELYKNDELVSCGMVYKPIFGLPRIKFTKLEPGDYVVKIYRKILSRDKKIISIAPVTIDGDKEIHVSCTWQKDIKVTARDQNNARIKDIGIDILKDDKVIISNITEPDEDLLINVPFSLESYILKAHYKGFTVYNEKIPLLDKKVNINLNLYDLTVDVKDKLGFEPGVDVKPLLTSADMDATTELTPDESTPGKYVFKNLPSAEYKLQVTYGRFSDTMNIKLPGDGNSASIKFTAAFDLSTELLDSRGNQIEDKNLKLDLKRDGKTVYESISPDEILSLSPGKYTINVYSEGKLVGTKTEELTTDKDIRIVTGLEPILPKIVTGLVIVFILEMLVLIIFKKISLNTFLKLLALSLVIISLFQPWWTLNATNQNISAEKTSQMFIFPQTMIESTTYNNQVYREIATLPEMFTNFVGTLLIIIVSGIILLCLSFIPNILLKKRFFIVLISASAIFIILVSVAFSFGMSKIAEISLGSLNGEAPLDVTLPTGETVSMQSTWGLGVGFYLCIIAALILICAGVIDLLNKKKWKKRAAIKK